MTTTTFNTARQPKIATTTNNSLLSLVRLAFAARRQRLALRNLDDTALADLGISRAQAAAEAARPSWDVPTSWLR